MKKFSFTDKQKEILAGCDIEFDYTNLLNNDFEGIIDVLCYDIAANCLGIGHPTTNLARGHAQLISFMIDVKEELFKADTPR